MRDFTLALVDKNNDPITSSEYLENSLKEIYGYSDDVEAKNRIKKVLKSFFVDRSCITMVRPCTNEADLQNLSNMELKDLREDFRN